MNPHISSDELTQAALDLGDLSAEQWREKWARKLIDAHRDLTKRYVLGLQVQQWLARAGQHGVAMATECLKACGTRSSGEVLRQSVKAATESGVRQIQVLSAMATAAQEGKPVAGSAEHLTVDGEDKEMAN